MLRDVWAGTSDRHRLTVTIAAKTDMSPFQRLPSSWKGKAIGQVRYCGRVAFPESDRLDANWLRNGELVRTCAMASEVDSARDAFTRVRRRIRQPGARRATLPKCHVCIRNQQPGRGHAQWDRPHFTYSPRGNPTVRCLELKIADLEGTEASVAFSSGMAAVSGVLLTLLADGGASFGVRPTL